jgi:glycosyltransferase involved in cell wall biosynthesis
MRILQIVNSPEMGGAEKLVAEMVPLFAESQETDVLFLRMPETPLSKDLQSKTRGQIISLGMGSVYNPLHIFRLIKYLRRYEVVHVHLFPALYWVAIARWLSFSRARFIYTEHSTSNNRRGKWYFRIIDRLIYRAYDKIVSITEQVRDNLKRHLSFDESHFACISNGIDVDRFASAQAYPKTDFFSATSLLIQVSSFRYPKDQMTLVKALSHLEESVALLLLGTGPTLESVKDEVIRLGLESRVKFLGNRMDVDRLLKTADVVILSSHYEGLSLSSLEGMASGRPFVATDAPGLSDTVAGAGLLFKPSDDRELAQIIQKLLSDRRFYQQTADACQARAAQYDIRQTVKQYIHLFNEIR